MWIAFLLSLFFFFFFFFLYYYYYYYYYYYFFFFFFFFYPKLSTLFHFDCVSIPPSLPPIFFQATRRIEESVRACNAHSSDIVGYITKMVAVDPSCLVDPEARSAASTASKLRREDVIAKLRAQGG